MPNLWFCKNANFSFIPSVYIVRGVCVLFFRNCSGICCLNQFCSSDEVSAQGKTSSIIELAGTQMPQHILFRWFAHFRSQTRRAHRTFSGIRFGNLKPNRCHDFIDVSRSKMPRISHMLSFKLLEICLSELCVACACISLFTCRFFIMANAIGCCLFVFHFAKHFMCLFIR